MSFVRAATRGMGSAGEGNVYDHIVEQSQIGRSGFAPEIIHIPANLRSVPTGRIQPVVATLGCWIDCSCSLKTSAGVRQPSVFRGRLLSVVATASRISRNTGRTFSTFS